MDSVPVEGCLDLVRDFIEHSTDAVRHALGVRFGDASQRGAHRVHIEDYCRRVVPHSFAAIGGLARRRVAANDIEHRSTPPSARAALLWVLLVMASIAKRPKV